MSPLATGAHCERCYHQLDLHGTPKRGRCRAYFGNGRYCDCDLTTEDADEARPHMNTAPLSDVLALDKALRELIDSIQRGTPEDINRAISRGQRLLDSLARNP